MPLLHFTGHKLTCGICSNISLSLKIEMYSLFPGFWVFSPLSFLLVRRASKAVFSLESGSGAKTWPSLGGNCFMALNFQAMLNKIQESAQCITTAFGRTDLRKTNPGSHLWFCLQREREWWVGIKNSKEQTLIFIPEYNVGRVFCIHIFAMYAKIHAELSCLHCQCIGTLFSFHSCVAGGLPAVAKEQLR